MIDDIRICLIWAMARNRVIGRDNTLPWRLRSDMQHFKRTTMGKPVIMGRKTFESFRSPLPGRTNILLTRNTQYRAAAVTIVHTLEDALEVASAQCLIDGQRELYVTEVQADVEGDTFFPEFDRSVWHEVSRVQHPAGDRDSYPCSISVLDRA